MPHVVGESTTPSIKEHDLFIIISGSGSTEHLRLLAEKHNLRVQNCLINYKCGIANR